MPYLIEIEQDGTESGTGFSFESTITLGRSLECDIQINDLEVSRVHAHIFPVDSVLFIKDGSPEGKPSKNGVFLNSKKVVVAPLGEGDLIQIGKHSFIVNLNETKTALTLRDKISLANYHLSKSERRNQTLAFDEQGIILYVSQCSDFPKEVAKENLQGREIGILFAEGSLIHDLLTLAASLDGEYLPDEALAVERDAVTVRTSDGEIACHASIDRQYLPQVGLIYVVELEPVRSLPDHNDETAIENLPVETTSVTWASVADRGIHSWFESSPWRFVVVILAAIIVSIAIAWIRSR